MADIKDIHKAVYILEEAGIKANGLKILGSDSVIGIASKREDG